MITEVYLNVPIRIRVSGEPGRDAIDKAKVEASRVCGPLLAKEIPPANQVGSKSQHLIPTVIATRVMDENEPARFAL